MDINAEAFISAIDGFLTELGTSGLVDARKARDQLMDLRLLFMTAVLEVEECATTPTSPTA